MAPDRPAPSVTVAIPTRGRPEMLRRAVQAVFDQEYPGDITCLVVFDQTAVALPEVVQRPGRAVTGVVNERAPGLAGARNTGYLRATGDLVALCDDDDEWLPGKLAAQVALLRAVPAASVASCGILVGYRGRDTPRRAPARPLELTDLLRDRHMEVHPSTYLARRQQVLEEIGLVDEELAGGYAEDYEWLLRAVRTGPVVCLPQPLVRVHWHDASFFVSRWETIDAALRQLLERVPEFSSVPAGRARIDGQIAFANAAMGRRREALGWAARALRSSPGTRQAWAAVLVASGAVSADRVLSLGRRIGRGV